MIIAQLGHQNRGMRVPEGRKNSTVPDGTKIIDVGIDPALKRWAIVIQRM
jgi:hypothetical protein